VFEVHLVNYDGLSDGLANRSFVAVDEIVAAVVETYYVLVCWMVVAFWGCMMTAAVDLPLTVMKGFVAAFDYGNLGLLFGCSYHELAEVLPLNEYCPLAPFDETFQDVVVSYHLKRFVVVLEGYCCTSQYAC
jgi:hypothetical protein